MNKKLCHSSLRGIEVLEDRRTMAAGTLDSLSLSTAPMDVEMGAADSTSPPAGSTSTPAGAPATGGTFSVTDYGVIAGSSSVQTAAIQRVFELAARSGSGATVRFAPGLYVTDQINVPENIGNIIGTGATLRLAPLSGDFARILNVVGTTPGNRPLLTIDGFEFDLNHDQQGWTGGYGLSHQAAIFLAGEKGESSLDSTRVNVAIKNVYMRDGAGDGIYVHHNATATITDVRAKDIYRGALTITGDGANVIVTRFKTSGSVFPTGLDIEPNNPGDTVNVEVVDSEFMGEFDVVLTPGSSFTGTNVTASGRYYLYNDGGTFRLDKSTLYVNKSYIIRRAGDSQFTNSTFILTRNGLTTSNAATIRGVTVSWYRAGIDSTGQSVVFDNVQFQTDATIRAIDTVVGIAPERDKVERNNWLTVKSSSIDGQFDQGIAFSGGNLRVEDTYINSTVAYVPSWSAGYYYNAEFDGNQLGPRVTTYWSTTYDEPHNEVAHWNTILTSAQNKFVSSKSMHRLGANLYTGTRTITGNFDPTLTRTPGLVGDVFVKSPTEKWTATRGDYIAATWVRLTPM